MCRPWPPAAPHVTRLKRRGGCACSTPTPASFRACQRIKATQSHANSTQKRGWCRKAQHPPVTPPAAASAAPRQCSTRAAAHIRAHWAERSLSTPGHNAVCTQGHAQPRTQRGANSHPSDRQVERWQPSNHAPMRPCGRHPPAPPGRHTRAALSGLCAQPRCSGHPPQRSVGPGRTRQPGRSTTHTRTQGRRPRFPAVSTPLHLWCRHRATSCTHTAASWVTPRCQAGPSSSCPAPTQRSLSSPGPAWWQRRILYVAQPVKPTHMRPTAMTHACTLGRIGEGRRS